MLRRLAPAIALALIAALPADTRAQGNSDHGPAAIRVMAEASFSDSDRREIETWFRLAHRVIGTEDSHTKSKHQKEKGMPPGLAKRDSLPPGLAKRDALPPGLAKRDLPSGLERSLSRLPNGMRRSQIGDDIVLIEEATSLILDILRGVARN